MAGFNKVLLLGNLTRDPQLSYTPNQVAVADFGLATNRKWTGQDGAQREETCFVDCRAFGRLAENINKYMTKGRPIFIEGRLTFDSWTAQDGTRRSKHRVTVENFQFLPGTADSTSNQTNQSSVRDDLGSEQPTPQGRTSSEAEDTFRFNRATLSLCLLCLEV
jgi:single-strand DNA-binding protein